jgi:hypothetical protein
MAPGCHHLSGIQALAFVRARHVDSDFGRIGRQQEFMRALVAKLESKGNLADLPKLMRIADIATDHLETDHTLSTATAIGLARRLASSTGLDRHAGLSQRGRAAALRRLRRLRRPAARGAHPHAGPGPRRRPAPSGRPARRRGDVLTVRLRVPAPVGSGANSVADKERELPPCASS